MYFKQNTATGKPVAVLFAIKLYEAAVQEEMDFVQSANKIHFYDYQIGWGSGIGFYFDNYEHYHQADAPWRPEFNVSNISWSKNSWQGPRKGWDNSKYVGDEFYFSKNKAVFVSCAAGKYNCCLMYQVHI